MKSFRSFSSLVAVCAAVTLLSGCGGNSANPNAVELDTTPPPPPANASVAIDPVSGDHILSWSASAAADLAGYQVHVANGDGSSYALAAEVPSGGTSYTLPVVDGRAREWYRVRAVDTSANASGWSRSVEVVRGEFGGGSGGGGRIIED